KQCILSESRFDFLKDLVMLLPDVPACEYEDGGQPNASVQPPISDPASVKVQVYSQSVNMPDELKARINVAIAGVQGIYYSMSRGDYSSVIRQIQEVANVPHNKEDRGCVPPPEPTFVSSNKLNLNFYKESEEASISGAKNLGRQAAARSPHICIQDAEDSGSEHEEECRVPAIVPQYAQPKASVALLDEDYDT
ncbi:hypothetical protein B7P43_G05283, partial [Cryptotermes secundus]